LPQDIRLNAAKIVAPYVHPRPQPEPQFVSFELPESAHSPDGLNQIHLGVLKAIATGELSLDEGKDISLLVENQRRIIETTDIVARLAKLEASQPR
jgi:hypothetical protein